MIGKLRGRVDEIEESAIILDIGGVGYTVEVPSRVASALERGASAALHIETVVREDAIRLFGFQSAEEKAWFRLLQNVQGVGARTALAVLSALTVSELLAAIAAQDSSAVSKAQGVGAKLAKRIVTELRDKAPAVPIVLAPGTPLPQSASRADAISALVNLGYPTAQATSAIDRTLVRLGEKAPVEDLIREGLKAIA